MIYSNVDMTSTGNGASQAVTGTKLTVQIINKTGQHQGGVIAIQGSLDDSNWGKIARIKGRKALESFDIGAMKHVRYRVVETEADTSTIDIIIEDR